jgi:hypothetical protein
LKSLHASGAAGTPKCVTCHGRYDVFAPTDEMFVAPGTRNCSSCHAADSPQAATIKALYESITASAKQIKTAEDKLHEAVQASLIVEPEEAKLAEARTGLISARAVQHSLDVKQVKDRTDKSVVKAKEVLADSEKAIAEEVFRRQVMGIGLGIMALSIASLYVVRRELYKQLPPE